jgi:hypothetical protein
LALKVLLDVETLCHIRHGSFSKSEEDFGFRIIQYYY